MRKFRNIVDSGDVAVEDDVTCLVGKNEAGKSAMLEALYLLNPAYNETFDVEDQYPRWLVAPDRRKGDLSTFTPIEATFELDEDDLQLLRDRLGERAITGKTFTLKKRYSGGTVWSIPTDEEAAVKHAVSQLPSKVAPRLRSCVTREALLRELDAIEASEEGDGPAADDISTATEALQTIGIAEKEVWNVAADLLTPHLPVFFRFTEYHTLPGRIDFRKLAQDGDSGPASSGLQTARALLELASTEIDRLGEEDYELRRGELEAVQIDLTRQVFEYWKQNPDLEVKIDVDKVTESTQRGQQAVARYLDIRVYDRRTGYSNNFRQRSSGFQWFFSFLAAFSEFEGRDEPVIVLLDEPALTLHGKAQADFLRFINERLAPNAPVLYTTHSPFMVEPDRFERVRLVEDRGPDEWAVTTSDVLVSDPDSLFPLQAALGYDIAQNLFVGPHNLVVEGTSDFIYLTVVSRLLLESDRTGLDDRWRILPAGGATNIPTFVALVGPHLDITVLADSDTRGMKRVTNMVTKGLLTSQRLVLASDAFDNTTRNADLEDLFSEGDYLTLFNGAFGENFKVKDLPPGDRITKRIESLHGDYDHGVPAEWFLRHHDQVSLTETSLSQWEKLIDLVNETIST